MKRTISLCIFIATLCVPAFAGGEHEKCERMLQTAMARLGTDEDMVTLVDEQISLADGEVGMIQDATTIATQEDELDLMLSITLPPGYRENESAFLAARERARKHLIPLLEAIKKSLKNMDPGLTFAERLMRLARHYDDPHTSNDEKTAVITQMMKMFSISVEHHYINLITEKSLSENFKRSMYRALTLIFKHDPSWQPPLEQAMRNAGLR